MLHNQVVRNTDANFFQRRACAYMEDNNLELAIVEFAVVEKLIKTTPQDFYHNSLYLKRAVCYSRLHQVDKAIADLSVVLSNFYDDTTVVESLLSDNLYETIEYALRPGCSKDFSRKLIKSLGSYLNENALNLIFKFHNVHIVGIFTFFQSLLWDKYYYPQDEKKVQGSILVQADRRNVSPEIITAIEVAKSEADRHKIAALKIALNVCEDDDAEKKNIYLNLAKLSYSVKEYDDAIIYFSLGLILFEVRGHDACEFLFHRAFAYLKNEEYENAIDDFYAVLSQTHVHGHRWFNNISVFEFEIKSPAMLSAIAHYHRGIAYLLLGNSYLGNQDLIKYMQKTVCAIDRFSDSLAEYALNPACPDELRDLVQERFIKLALASDENCEDGVASRKISNFYLSLIARRNEIFVDTVDLYNIILREANFKIPELVAQVKRVMKKDSFSSINCSKSFSQSDIFSMLQIKPQPNSTSQVEELFTADMLEADEGSNLVIEMDICHQEEKAQELQRSAFSFIN
jgi:tetratricopeptide (TPR) repeat protein